MSLLSAEFETAIGLCAVLWSPLAIAGVCLPRANGSGATTRFSKTFVGATAAAPPEPVAVAMVRMTALLEGSGDDLQNIALDLTGVGDFELKVYDLARAIRPGETRTYGDLAKALGNIALSRAVGQALGANPCPIIIPCHRILGAGGRSGGFSAPGGLETKARMLTIERARTSAAPMLFDDLPVDFGRQR